MYTRQRRKGIQLCYPFEEKRIAKWGMPAVYVQPKLDGDRCRALLPAKGVVLLLSSEEHDIVSVPHITYELEKAGLPVGTELDGELYKHNVLHQDVHSIVGRTINIHDDFESIEYRVFDLPSHERPYMYRMEKLKELFEVYFKGNKYIKIVDTDMIKDANGDKILQRMQEYTLDNYEGIIIRNPAGLYTRKRDTNIMKFKPKKEDTYIIVGYEEEISIHGERKDTLGALILQSDEHQIFKVGSGSFLTRERRKELWENRNHIKGNMAHIAYQTLTARRVPCFPVLISILSIEKQEKEDVSGVEKM